MGFKKTNPSGDPDDEIRLLEKNIEYDDPSVDKSTRRRRWTCCFSWLIRIICSPIDRHTLSTLFSDKFISPYYKLGRNFEHKYEKYSLAYHRYNLIDVLLVLNIFTLGVDVPMYVFGSTAKGIEERTLIYLIAPLCMFVSSCCILFCSCLPCVYRRPVLFMFILFAAIVSILICGGLAFVREESDFERLSILFLLLVSSFSALPTRSYVLLSLGCLLLAILLKATLASNFDPLWLVNDTLIFLFVCWISVNIARILDVSQRRRVFVGEKIKYKNAEILLETRKANALLKNSLPPRVIRKLRDMDGDQQSDDEDEFSSVSSQNNEKEWNREMSTTSTSRRMICWKHDQVAIMFAAIDHFNIISSHLSALDTVTLLNAVFTQMDRITEKHNLWRVKTIGSIHMSCSGLLSGSKPHILKSTILAATEIIDIFEETDFGEVVDLQQALKVRIGVEYGNVISAVLGTKSLAYDLYGTSVNFASRMCSSLDTTQCVQFSKNVYDNLNSNFLKNFRVHGPIEIQVKGVGLTNVWQLLRKESFKKSKSKMSIVPSASTVSFSSLDSTPTSTPTSTQSPAKKLKRAIKRKKRVADHSPASKIFELMAQKMPDSILNQFPEPRDELPLDKMANSLSKKIIHKKVTFSESNMLGFLKIILPGILIYCNCKMNWYYLRKAYKAQVSQHRRLLLFIILIFPFTFINDVIFQHLGFSRFDSLLKLFIVKMLICFPIVLISSGCLLTPLFSRSLCCFNCISISSILGILGATLLFTFLFGHNNVYTVFFFIILMTNFLLQGLYYWTRFFIAIIISGFALFSEFTAFDKDHTGVAPMSANAVDIAVSICRHLVFHAILNYNMFISTIQQMEDAYVRAVNHKKMRFLEKQREQSRLLLLSTFPQALINKLESENYTGRIVADFYDSLSLIFADIRSFTVISAQMEPMELVHMLSDIYSTIDGFCDQYKIYRCKLIGDCFQGCSELDSTRHHQENMADFAFQFLNFVKSYRNDIQFRIGIHTGSVIGGVCGVQRIFFDLFGEHVSIAEAMEQNGQPNRIHVSEAFQKSLKKNEKYIFIPHLTDSEYGKTFFIEDATAAIEEENLTPEDQYLKDQENEPNLDDERDARSSSCDSTKLEETEESIISDA